MDVLDPILNTSGERIAYLRKKSGLSQKELGKKIDFPSDRINNYEQNKAAPSDLFVERAAEYFGCSSSFIIDGIPQANKYGFDALALLRKTPHIDEAVLDFVEDQLVALSIKAEKYDQLISLVIRLKAEVEALKKG